MEAAAPDFSYGSNGKPYFPDYPQFHFSISHSGNYAVCAASDCEVGVDIQEIRPVKASIAERFFTETERMQMERVTGDEEIRMLFRIWSAKESYVKLTGRGMAEGLQTFTADLENGRIWRADTACAAYLKEYKAPAHYVLTACGYAQDFEEIHIYEI